MNARSERFTRFVLSLLSAFTLIACVALLGCTGMEGDESVASTRAKVGRFPHSTAKADCFFPRRVDNFEVLNDSNLLVFDGRRRVYHVEVAPPAMDLRHAYGIEFYGTSGRICGNAGERMRVRNGTLSSFPQSVVGVYRLDENMEAVVRAHFGQATALPVPPEDQEADAIEELVTDLEDVPGDSSSSPVESPADASAGTDQEDVPGDSSSSPADAPTDAPTDAPKDAPTDSPTDAPAETDQEN